MEFGIDFDDASKCWRENKKERKMEPTRINVWD